MPQFAYDRNLGGLTSKAQKHTNWIYHQPRHTVQPATSIQAFTCTPVALNRKDVSTRSWMSFITEQTFWGFSKYG